jgi:hypothetical protein
MLERIGLLILLLLLVSSAFGQDIIYTANGDKIEVKVVSVNPENVLYEIYGEEAGESKTILKKDILVITYENGKYEVFYNTNVEEENPDQNPFAKNTKRHLVSIDAISILIDRFSVAYEHISEKGYFGFKVPVFAGFSDYRTRELYGVGIDFKYYPGGQGGVRYFLGPSLRSVAKRSSNTLAREYTGGIYIQNGVLFQPASSINVSISFGLGAANIESSNISGHGIFSVDMIYRF